MRPAPVAPLFASATMSSSSTSPSREQRHERQHHRGRVAARVRDEPRAGQALAVDLGEAEHRLADQLRRLVLVAVPLLVRLGASAGAGRRRGRRRRRPGARRAAGPRTSPRRRGAGRGSTRPPAASRPASCARWPAAAAGRERDPRARVPTQQAHELAPRVARRPEDADACAHGSSPPDEKTRRAHPAGRALPLAFACAARPGRRAAGRTGGASRGPGLERRRSIDMTNANDRSPTARVKGATRATRHRLAAPWPRAPEPAIRAAHARAPRRGPLGSRQRRRR